MEDHGGPHKNYNASPSVVPRGSIYYSETRLTRPRMTRKLAYLKPSYMVLAWVMKFCWAYLKPLVITRTEN